MSRQVQYNKNNPVKVRLFNMLGVIKRKCKNADISYDLTSEWLRDKLEGLCDATGMPFDMHDDGPFLPVIQRRDKNQGYTIDNSIVVIKIYSVANDDHILYQFCRQYTTMYDILYNTKAPKFPGV